MAEIRTITSPQNEAYKQTATYTHSKEAKKDNVVLVEGVRAVEEVLKARDWPIRSIWLAESLAKDAPGYLKQLQLKAPCQVNLITDEMMKRLSDTQTPQGILTVVERKNRKVAQVLAEVRNAGKTPLFLILENLQDPGNVGTLLRTADAVDADAVIVTKGTVDIYAPKVIRAAMGSLLHIPVCVVESVRPLAEALKQTGFSVLAAALQDSVYIYDVDMTKPTAILIGNEGSGLTREAMDSATSCVKIPMPGQAESLNAAMAGGVILYEALRQREIMGVQGK